MTNITYFLTLNRYSRIGKEMKIPMGIVLHDSINEGYSAIAERNYMDNLKLGKNAIYYSTHYIVGLNGEVINCVPENEIAYHRGSREDDGEYISIEYCTKNASKTININTKTAVKALICDIAKRYSFDVYSNLLRHSDIAEKKCPAFYSKNDKAWNGLKDEISNEIEISDKLMQESEAISDSAGKLLDIDKRYIRLILERKASPDIKVISRLFDYLPTEKQK